MGNTISVIIPSYNSHKTIRFTLDNLLAQLGDYLEEIIVVDSSDDIKTRELLSKYEKNVILKFLDEKTIPAVGRNIGAQIAKGTIVAFIDSDAYPAPDWSEKIMNLYHEGVKVGGGSYEIPPFQKLHPLALAQYFIQFSEFLKRGEKRQKKFVPSCNLYCEKKIFFESNGFPEIRAMEDVQFGNKISLKYPLIFDPKIIVSHIFRDEMKSYLDNQFMLGKFNGISRQGNKRAYLKKSLFFYVLVPFCFIMKITLIMCRLFVKIDINVLLFILSLPIIVVGIWYWALGFASSARFCGGSNE